MQLSPQTKPRQKDSPHTAVTLKQKQRKQMFKFDRIQTKQKVIIKKLKTRRIARDDILNKTTIEAHINEPILNSNT